MLSEKFGGLPVLSEVWNYGPWAAAFIMVVVDFGILCTLQVLEGIPPWQRGQYFTFRFNDTIFIPLFMAMATVIVEKAPLMHGFYTERWWHLLALGLAFGISILMEVGAVKNGQYTMSQELSPSKLWHTFIFGIVGYWLISILMPVIVHAGYSPLAAVVAMVAAVGFIWMMYLDATTPFPPDAHLEGSWGKWDWHRRIY